MGNPYDIPDDDPEYQQLLQRYGVGGSDKKTNAPGFASAFRNALGSTVQGAGQLLSDAGWHDNPVEAYGKDVQARNPMDINSLSDIWERPGDAIAQGTGMALGYIGPALVGGGLGVAGKLAAAPKLMRAGAALNSMPAQVGLAALPSFGGIREKQEEDGNNSFTDKALAGLAGLAVGGIEVGFGPQRMLGIGRGAIDKIPTKADIVSGFGKTALKTGVKQGARVVGEEMGEELAQNPIEQLASYQNPTSKENIDQTLTGAALAGMGTLGFGAAGGAHAGMRHKSVVDRVQKDLLNPSAVPLGDLRDTAEWNRELLAKEGSAATADAWYNDFMRNAFDERNQEAFQADQAARAAQMDEVKSQLYKENGANPEQLALPAPGHSSYVIPAEGGEHQLPLDRLDILQQRRRDSTAAEEENALLSADKHEVDSQQLQSATTLPAVEADRVASPDGTIGEAGFTTQNVPMPTDIGSALGVLRAASQARLQEQPIVAGTPLHNALLEADSLLRQAGVDPAKVFGGISRQETTRAAVTKKSAPEKPPVVRSKGKKVAEFEAKLAAAIAEGKIAADDDIVAEWEKTPKNAVNARTMSASLDDKLSGPNVPVPTAEQNLKRQAVTSAVAKIADPTSLGLTAKQAPVFNHIQTAIAEGRTDDILDADGTFKYSAIGDALGMARGSAKSFIDGAAKKIAESQGVSADELRAALRDTAKKRRKVEASDHDRLGLSPKDQLSVATEQDYLGSGEGGAEQNMGIINSIGGSQSDIGADGEENVAPLDLPRTPEQKAVDDAIQKTRETAAIEGMREEILAAVSNPNAPAARGDWNELASELDIDVPDFDSIPPRDAVAWINEYSDIVNDHEGSFDELWSKLQEAFHEAVQDLENDDGRGSFETQTASELTSVPRIARPDEQARLGVRQDSGEQAPESNEAARPNEAESSPGAETVAEDSEEVVLTPKSISAAWNAGVEGSPLPTFAALREEERQWLLGATTEEALQSRAQEIVDQRLQGEDATYSESGGHGSDAKKIEATLKKLFFSPEKFDKLVKVVQSIRQLPPAEYAVLSQASDPKKVAGVTYNGRVLLIADNIMPGQELGLLLHEVGVHLGMRKLLGAANMTKLVSQIKTWAAQEGTTESTLAKLAVRRASKSSSTNVNEEYVAYFIEEAVKHGIDPTAVNKMREGTLKNWFRTLWAAAKVALRKIGLGRTENLTAQNLVDLAYGAAKLEFTGAWHGTAAEFRKFDHSYMGSGEGAQAFGWGTYLAQRPGIAKKYWKDDVRRKGATVKAAVRGKALADQPPEVVAMYERFKTVNGGTWFFPAGPASQRQVDEGSKFASDFNIALSMLLPTERNEVLGASSDPEGSLMRVDSNVHDDEFLDWDKPVSEQSEVVKKALEKVGLVGSAFVNPSGRRIYEEEIPMLTGVTNDKAASEYLDSVGIKGIKFLDAHSRSNNGRVHPTLSEVGLSSLAGPVEQYGKEKVIPSDAKLAVRGNVIYVQLEGGGLRDYVALDRLSRNGYEVLDDQGRLDALFAIKKYVPNQTHNLVIFNDKNLTRVATEVGASPDRIKFSEAISEAAERIAGATGKSLIDDTKHYLKKLGHSMLFLNDVIDRAKEVLPSSAKWYDAYNRMLEKRNSMERTAEAIAAKADLLNVERLKKVNDFLGESTFEQKWGFQPKWKKEQVEVDGSMRAKYNALTPEERSLVEDVFKAGDDFIAARDELFKKLGVDDKAVTGSRLPGPYAPLKRFGNYVALFKSKALLDAEKASDGSKAAKASIDEMKSDPKHYEMRMFDTIGQANRYVEKNSARFGGGLSTAFEGKQRLNELAPMDYSMLQKVMSAVKADNAPASVRTMMENTIRDLYIQSVEETSARKAGLKRKYRAGYDEDMLRSFLANARANAIFMSNIEFGGEMNDAFYAMEQEAKGADGRRGGQDLYNTITNHYAENLKYDPTPISDRVTALTSAWQLSTSIGYHVQNATQGMMVSVPWLAGQFNDYRGAWSNLMKGYKTLTSIWNSKGYKGVDLSKIKDAGLRNALQHASDRGLIDVGFQEDLSHFDRTRTGYAAVDNASGAAASIMHRLHGVARMVETWNRVASAVAAYNMAKEHGKTDAQAQEYVTGVLHRTQGDFTRAGAPLLLKKLPKPTVQYKKYQFMMGAFYVNAFQKAFGDASAEEKAIGKRMLGYKLFHTAMAAGALGLPLMNLAQLVFSALGGDDDGEDLEGKLRKMIGDKNMADILLHGPLAGLGFDMNSKLGDDKIFSIAPYTNVDLTSSKGLIETAAGIAGGPALSLAGNMANGIGLIAKGDLYKGTEKLLPKGFASAMESFRLGNEGFTLKNGDVLVKPEDIGAFALTLNALGMPSTDIKTIKWLNGRQYEVAHYYTEQTKELKDRYVKASREGDRDTMNELREDWVKLQKSKDEVRYYFNNRPDELKRAPLSELITAPVAARKREMKHERSVPNVLD